METLQAEVSWGMGPRFKRQGLVRVVRETGVPLAAVGTLEPPKKLPEQLVARQRPYPLYRLHPSQVHVHNHPPRASLGPFALSGERYCEQRSTWMDSISATVRSRIHHTNGLT